MEVSTLKIKLSGLIPKLNSTVNDNSIDKTDNATDNSTDNDIDGSSIDLDNDDTVVKLYGSSDSDGDNARNVDYFRNSLKNSQIVV